MFVKVGNPDGFDKSVLDQLLHGLRKIDKTDAPSQSGQQNGVECDSESLPNQSQAPKPAKRRRKYSAAGLSAVFLPVTLTMLLTVLSAKTWMWEYLKASDSGLLSAASLEGDGGEDTNTWDIVKWTVIIACCFVAIVVTATLVMLCCFKLKCDKCCNIFLGIMLLLNFAVILIFLIPRLVTYLRIPMDFPLWAFVTFNILVVAGFCMFWKGPKCLIHGLQILMMVGIALTIGSLLPEWTTWVLVGLLAIWDCIAVIPKKGPLRQLVQTMDDHGTEINAALIYSTIIFLVDEKKETDRAPTSANASNDAAEDAGQTEGRLEESFRRATAEARGVDNGFRCRQHRCRGGVDCRDSGGRACRGGRVREWRQIGPGRFPFLFTRHDSGLSVRVHFHANSDIDGHSDRPPPNPHHPGLQTTCIASPTHLNFSRVCRVLLD